MSVASTNGAACEMTLSCVCRDVSCRSPPVCAVLLGLFFPSLICTTVLTLYLDRPPPPPPPELPSGCARAQGFSQAEIRALKLASKVEDAAALKNAPATSSFSSVAKPSQQQPQQSVLLRQRSRMPTAHFRLQSSTAGGGSGAAAALLDAKDSVPVGIKYAYACSCSPLFFALVFRHEPNALWLWYCSNMKKRLTSLRVGRSKIHDLGTSLGLTQAALTRCVL
jgi:hypothetical protein